MQTFFSKSDPNNERLLSFQSYFFALTSPAISPPKELQQICLSTKRNPNEQTDCGRKAVPALNKKNPLRPHSNVIHGLVNIIIHYLCIHLYWQLEDRTIEHVVETSIRERVLQMWIYRYFVHVCINEVECGWLQSRRWEPMNYIGVALRAERTDSARPLPRQRRSIPRQRNSHGHTT